MRSPTLLFLFGLVGLLVAAPAYAIGTPTEITVSPDHISTTVDKPVSLVVTAKDAAGQSANVTGQSVFGTDDPRGSMAGAIYHPGKVGDWKISIAYQGFSRTIEASVAAGKLTELTINPNSNPEVIALDATRDFSIQGFDAKNNRVAVTNTTWSTSGGLGTISKDGVFRATKIGRGSVSVSSGTVSVTIPVQVVASRFGTANTNSSTGGNSNVSRNTNGNSNANANTNVNSNVNSNANQNVNGSTSGTTDEGTPCTNRKNWLWGIILLALLGGIAILYAFVPITKTWPAIVGLGTAVIVTILERNYGCSDNAWWPWVAILGAAGLTVLAFQQVPRESPPAGPKPV